MTARDYLESIQIMDIEIEQLTEEIKELRERSFAISGTNFDAPERGKGGFNTNAPYAAIIERMVDLELLVAQKVERLAWRRHKVIGQIHKVANPLFIQVLYKRYVQYKPLGSIAEELNYDYGYMRRVHMEAVEEFDKARNKKAKEVTKSNTM